MDAETRKKIDEEKAKRLPTIISNPELLAAQRRITTLELELSTAVKKYADAGGQVESAGEHLVRFAFALISGSLSKADLHDMVQEQKVFLNELPMQVGSKHLN